MNDKIYKISGKLSLEMLKEAKKAFQQRVLPNGSLLQLEQRVDVLPLPKNDGDIVFGESFREYRAMTIDNLLQWQATGWAY